ncbi:VanZ family protein [Peribacillus sp. FSL H8-0477]|uniref:VanZ family protein n=1 Tax=Peribacillus sp. FSL H8-0477 TaxID=2921388 RepID=UPI004046E7E4
MLETFFKTKGRLHDEENLNYPVLTILLFYLLLLTYTVFIGRDSIRSVNLIPFHSIKNFIIVDNGIGGTRIIDMNIWGNILMFIPAGIYLILQKHNKIYQ